MNYIDIVKVCQEWYMRKFDVPCQKIKVSRLKLSVSGDCEWSTLDRGPEVYDTSRKVIVNFQDHHRDPSCDLTVTTSSSNSINVTLSQTVVKGLSKSVEIPFDDEVPEKVISIFGNSLKIDPGKQKDEKIFSPSYNEQHADISDNVNVEADIQTSESFYKGRFDCKLQLTGNVIFESNGEIKDPNIGQIVEEINTMTGGHLNMFGLVKDYRKNRLIPKGICWSAAGECELTWNPKPYIEWN
ncbi:hypothetical protein BgiMline_024847 [Biomphalaria glabrata]|uniref:Uncharacterized protein LOC106062303 n=1 Tax=Biomphalaria glabrata TaxID=6526 RepID=A0A2C9L753_BIOGL|nr:uncharacterized protein LOC106062303 [Biomphalaria glabrata]XP_013076022.1 uncharacterized protein LOC106062303 [Biomphalaria glabrata]XP_013076023.1 uncharacterized protein LOC106062303 [Biomphalaria glabrata]XP_013076025.1 uncharacterized protein LOC106062303 [Biomphalaria glabrata]KAI8760868.1 hypothetical protein BgiMline_008021 [Biomphalaria glabrata]